MHMNEYVLEVLTRERLAELRAQAERSNRIWAANEAPRQRRRFSNALNQMSRRLGRAFGRRLHIDTGNPVRGERTSTHGAVRG